jgi:putative membrane protein
MIANYTNHAANERTFLAWIRTGLAVAAFGFFLVKLNVLVDTACGVCRALRGLSRMPVARGQRVTAAPVDLRSFQLNPNLAFQNPI